MSTWNLKAEKVAEKRQAQEPDYDAVRLAVQIFADPQASLFVQSFPSRKWSVRSAADVDGVCADVRTWNDGRNFFFGVNPCGPLADPPKDPDILRRRWLFIDIDRNKTQQPDDPATDEEHLDAGSLAEEIKSYLCVDAGFPDPVQVDSGNGFHLYYRVELANDADSKALVRDLLGLLDQTFSDARGEVGAECHDARRLSRMPGTWSRRGKASKTRPYRMAKFVHVPDSIEIVPLELLQALAGGKTAIQGVGSVPAIVAEPERKGDVLTKARKSEAARDASSPTASSPAATTNPPVAAASTNGAHQDGFVLKTRAADETEPVGAATSASVIGRVKSYLDAMPPAISGHKGHSTTFAAARAAVYGFGLGAELGFRVLWEHYNPRCVPPWSEKELRHKCQDADSTPFDKPRGWLLDESSFDKNGTAHGGGGTDDAVNGTDGGDASRQGRSKVNELPDDPDRLARLFLQTTCTDASNGKLTLRYWREDWYRWDGAAYRERSPEQIRAEVRRSIKPEFDRLNIKAIERWIANGKKGKKPTAIKVTNVLCANVEGAVRSHVLIRDETEPPTYLSDAGGPSNVLTLQNGLLDLDAYFAGKSQTLLPHTPDWFTRTAAPYAFESAAACPRWLSFLNHNLEGDAQRVAILQEWFGLCLVHDTSFHKCLLLEGDGKNGKSVVCAALESIIGTQNCSFLSLEFFGERFHLAATVGKLANIVPDCGEIDKVAEGFLKAFVSGNSMTFDRKNKTPIEGPATARLTVSFNNRPRFADRSSGLWRRLILMPMRVTITDDQRVPNMDKPWWWAQSGELPGILLWALAGLDRLRKQNKFTASDVCDKAIADYRLESNPARAFLDDFCEPDPNDKVPAQKLYAAYKDWATRNGYCPLADRKFGGEVQRAFLKARRHQATDAITNDRIWVYGGVKFNEKGNERKDETAF